MVLGEIGCILKGIAMQSLMTCEVEGLRDGIVRWKSDDWLRDG